MEEGAKAKPNRELLIFETDNYDEPVTTEYDQINLDIARKRVKAIPKEICKLQNLEKLVAWENHIR